MIVKLTIWFNDEANFMRILVDKLHSISVEGNFIDDTAFQFNMCACVLLSVSLKSSEWNHSFIQSVNIAFKFNLNKKK